ncbi:MAG: hypothetical protein QM642_06260, partial [Edaphocola sp.]
TMIWQDGDTPVVNSLVYGQWLNGNNYYRKTIGQGYTDSNGNYFLECSELNQGGDHILQPVNLNISGGMGDTTDVGVYYY